MPTFFVDFSSWLQGSLFILIAYHTGAYKLTKDKSFIIYAGYLLLVFIYLIPKTNNASSEFLFTRFNGFFDSINWIIQVWFWMLYSWFSLHFLEINKKNKKLNKNIRRYIQITTIISTLFFGVDLIFFKGKHFPLFFMAIYMPTSLIIISFFLRVIYSFKDRINKFFVFGLISFLGFSLIALYYSFNMNATILKYIRPIDFFMIGVLLEAIILSLGLGYKFYVFRKERDEYNELLIAELKNNHELKDLLAKQLSKKVDLLKVKELEAIYKNQINELKLSSLLSQMNPHFIFNALNSIKQYIISNDQKNAAHYLNKFSKLIRRILEGSNQKEVSLAEELETMNLYMAIENIRFSNHISYIINVDKEINTHKVKVPSLILQPFLENAIWHGLSSKKGEKQIIIEIKNLEPSYIEVKINDNGIGRIASAQIKAEKSLKRKSLGIELTQDRLEIFFKSYKNKYNIIYKDIIKNGDVLGTEVSLRLPLI